MRFFLQIWNEFLKWIKFYVIGAQSDKRYGDWLVELKGAVQTGQPAKIISILENGIKMFKSVPKKTDYNEMVTFVVGNFIKELKNSPKDGLKKVRIFADDMLKKRNEFIANMG